jgi:fructose-specific phosphotransferase system IIC component
MIGGAIMMGFGVSTAGVSGVCGLPMASKLGIFISAILVGTVISVALQIPVKKPLDQSSAVITADDDDLDFEITL